MTGRGLQGRRTARQLILFAVVCGLADLFGFVALPGATQPMFGIEPWYAPALPLVGLASYFLGLGWMIRLYRADPEPDRRSWRYRDS